MSFDYSTNVTALSLWDDMKADLPRWIYGAVRRMGLPQQSLGDTSASATRGALLQDRDLQQAVMGEVFLAIRESAERGRLPAEQEGARRWVCTVTGRIARRMATQQAPFTAARCATDADTQEQAVRIDPESLTEARQALRVVQQHLASADEVDRDILEGIMGGESPKEVAERTGFNEATVRSRLFRLRARLHGALSTHSPDRQAA